MMWSKQRVGVIAMVAVVSALGGILTAALSADTPKPPGLREDGTLDLAQLPKLVPVADSKGELAGYVDRDALLGPGTLPPAEAVLAGPQRLPVFAADGRTVVGSWVDDVGFVPLRD